MATNDNVFTTEAQAEQYLLDHPRDMVIVLKADDTKVVLRDGRRTVFPPYTPRKVIPQDNG